MTVSPHDQSRLHGRCHCGDIVFSTPTRLDFAAARRCDCSLCRRRWAVMVSCPLDQFILEKGAESLSLYQWNTAIAKHYFCKTCGIYTHHIRRSDLSVYGVNIGCFDDINICDYLATAINDRVSMSLAADDADC